jgi:hypothetical protein
LSLVASLAKSAMSRSRKIARYGLTRLEVVRC